MAQDFYPILIKKPDESIPLVYRLSKQQKDIIDSYMQTNSAQKTAQEVQVNYTTVQELLERPEIQFYIAERIRNFAHSIDLTPEKVLTKLNEIINSDGKVAYDSSFIRAIEIAAKITKVLKQDTQVVNVNIENPMAKYTDAELDKAIEERINATRRNPSKPEGHKGDRLEPITVIPEKT